MEDDDFQQAAAPPAAQSKSRLKLKKKDSSSSSRAPKPASVHVQSIGGGSSGGAAGGPPRGPGAAASPVAAPTQPDASATPVGAEKQVCRASAPGAGPSAQPLAEAVQNTQPESSPSQPPASGKRKASASAGEGAASQPKAKAARSTPKSTPRKTTPKTSPASATPKGGRLGEQDALGLVEAMVLRKNKPINGQVVSDALLGDGHKVSKPAVEKHLATLVEKGSVLHHEWGKAKLWWACQEQLAQSSDGGVDAKLTALEGRLPEMKQRAKAVAQGARLRARCVPCTQHALPGRRRRRRTHRRPCARALARPCARAPARRVAAAVLDVKKMATFEQLGEQLEAEEAACAALRERLAERVRAPAPYVARGRGLRASRARPSRALSATHAPHAPHASRCPRALARSQEAAAKGELKRSFTAAETKKLRTAHEKLRKEWQRRKLMLKDKLLEYIEASSKKLPALVEELGFELDEDVGVDAAEYGVKCKWPQK